MLKRIILIVLSVAVLVTGITAYYYNSLPVSEEVIKECQKDLKSSLFSGMLVGYADGSFSLPLQSIIRYNDGETVYVDMNSDYLRLVNGDNSLDCDGVDKFSSLIADGDDIYYFYPDDEFVCNVYKTDRNFKENKFFCTVPSENGYLAIENSVIYYDYEANGKKQIKRIVDGKEEVVFETEEDLIPLLAEEDIIYLRNRENEKIYSFDIESKKLKKLPLNFIATDINGYYKIRGAEIVSEEVMKVYLSYHWGDEDFEGTNVIYLFNTKTGRKLKVEV